MPQAVGTLKSVTRWALPNYAGIVLLVILAFVESYLPLRVQHTLESFWMLVALLLPISTIIAAVHAVRLSLRVGDESQIRIWQPVVGWCLVTFAVAFNMYSYIVISLTLR
jgi:hypothetical protein